MTISWEPYGPTTEEELNFFINERGGMTKGWTGSFDKLDAIFSDSDASVLDGLLTGAHLHSAAPPTMPLTLGKGYVYLGDLP